MAENSDAFRRHGFTWRRHWIGDNSGHYEWRTECGRLKAWGGLGQPYNSSTDERIATSSAASLLEAMTVAAGKAQETT